jgi:hypothetical protein
VRWLGTVISRNAHANANAGAGFPTTLGVEMKSGKANNPKIIVIIQFIPW